jgi:hypothetical protein
MRRTIDAYVLETLMPDLVGHDHQPSAFVVYLFLWHRTAGTRGRGAPISLRAIAEGTGLSKRGVQSALALLRRRRLVTVARASATATPVYRVLRPWIRPQR